MSTVFRYLRVRLKIEAWKNQREESVKDYNHVMSNDKMPNELNDVSTSDLKDHSEKEFLDRFVC